METAKIKDGPSPRVWGLLGRTWPGWPWPSGHPHVCGDYDGLARLRESWTGHPHVRGDYPKSAINHPADTGPSPRAWGLHPLEFCCEHAIRAIPTCVGTTERDEEAKMTRVGPSPRVWGLRVLKADGHGDVRAIPTCVGTTNLLGQLGPNPRAIPTCVGTTNGAFMRPYNLTGHPHVCGDYGRGPAGAREPGRAIPTCVGTTSPIGASASRRTGHPHVCGDYTGTLTVYSSPCGPSPRVWGLRRGRRNDPGLPRAIPTCVGTTPPASPRGPLEAGHPHVCGDYGSCMPGVRATGGPSPRVWGLRAGRQRCYQPGRAIPTCVGTTVDADDVWGTVIGPSPRVWGLRPGVGVLAGAVLGHPHVCGDYRQRHQANRQTHGPSPRVWGLRGRPRALRAPDRAIPTCVGTTSSSRPPSATPPGHPHVCGDYPGKCCIQAPAYGPSPRVWGLRVPTRTRSIGGRAIPTCVGTTGLWPLWWPTGSGHPHVCGDYT